MTAPKVAYECLGGPSDGEHVALNRNGADFAARIGDCWHLYSLQATDLGRMLVYQGAMTREELSGDSPRERTG